MRIREKQTNIDPQATGLLTALAYPDRIAQSESSGTVRLVTGQRARLATELFGEAEFYGIAQLDGNEFPQVYLAAPISRAEILKHFGVQLEQTAEIRWDEATGKVIARQTKRLGALVLEDTILPNANPEQVTAALLKALQERGISRLPWTEEAQALRQRLAFANLLMPGQWPDFSDEKLQETMPDWLGPYLNGLRSLNDIKRLDLAEILLSALSWEQQTELDRLAPTHLPVPSGSRIAIDYSNPEAPVLAVRLQEIFGLFDTPVIGGGKVALLIHLLSPAHRPVQVTRDLRSFWANGYFEVRKDLRGRYPKHYWPEDPLQ
ncbi:MAG TPA: ATP-dependent helicase C-terminal domain-containing protein, partial [Anseongella sp.]|nr:ATP-dependent helicase C-terminal domain-containing protein [Anseongella sp.]